MTMKQYLTKNSKSREIQKILHEALDILDQVGIPFGKSQRALERMAMCFLAVSQVNKKWSVAQDSANLKTRSIIDYINGHFEESISQGSYDDIRRKDLKLLLLSGLVVNTGVNKGSATNDPTRGYSLDTQFKNLVVTYKTSKWADALARFTEDKVALSEVLARKRDLERLPVKLPSGISFELFLGEHNVLQKALIEQFLPRFGSDCAVLYLGDTANKRLFLDESTLKKLNFFELAHERLPDIVAFSKKHNWLYLIEAVHSSGPMSETRVLELKSALSACTAELIFVTGFLTRTEFKRWMLDVAWETEVWIADNPDHLVHFNGHKFLGAYKPD